MSSTNTMTFQLECDEQVLNVYHLNPDNPELGTPYVAVAWPQWVYELEDGEPDYMELTMDMTDAVLTALRTENIDAFAPEVNRAMFTAISPGGSYQPHEVQFTGAPRPSVTSQMNLTADYAEGDRRSVKVSSQSQYQDITVYIEDPYGEGNRATDLGTIVLEDTGRYQVRLTWLEARKLAKALNDVTDIAELG